MSNHARRHRSSLWMRDIIDSLSFATEAMLLDLINRIAANRSNFELRKHFRSLLVRQLEKARKLIREVKTGEKTLGQDRVIKGWWKPNSYSELDCFGRETLSSWLS
jgi:hypothetical protein